MSEKEQQGNRQPGEITRRELLKGATGLATAYLLSRLSGSNRLFPNQADMVAAEAADMMPSALGSLPRRVNGVNFPSWSRGEYQQPPVRQALLGASSEIRLNAIGIKVTQYQDNYNSTHIGPTHNTPDESDIRSIISLAHQLGYPVMLAPQVNLTSDPDHWHGEIGANFSSEDWQTWFGSYQRMINGYADLARETGTELFVVGNEYITAGINRPGDWRATIQGVRNLYSGPLTYAAHHHEFGASTWWSDLDLLGLNPYHRLSSGGNPDKESLKDTWNSIIPAIESTVSKFRKDLIFPEIGYPSVKGASKEPWNYHAITNPNVPMSIDEQAICYQALYESFWAKPWWRGVFWWHWDTDPAVNGENNKAYSPRGKPAAAVMDYYGKVITGEIR